MDVWSCSIGLAARLVVGEHHVANANVEEQAEYFQDVHRLRLPAALNDENVRVLTVEPAATRGTWVPPASMSGSRKGKFWSKSFQFRWRAELMSRWIDICQAIGRDGSSKTTCHMDDCTGFEHFPFYKALGRAGSGIYADRSQFEKATTEERR